MTINGLVLGQYKSLYIQNAQWKEKKVYFAQTNFSISLQRGAVVLQSSDFYSKIVQVHRISSVGTES